MLPRTTSIFHLGEEDGEANKSGKAIREVESSKLSPASLVGLRILIENPGQESNTTVVKSSLNLRRPFTQGSQFPTCFQELGFLKTCYLCKRELSLQKDIYIYRGDQGFCSVECRCRQILLDERRELETPARERLELPHHRHTADSKVQQLNCRENFSAMA